MDPSSLCTSGTSASKYDRPFWNFRLIGFGIGTWCFEFVSTLVGYFLSDYLNNDLLSGLYIINPVYFMCMMIGAIKNRSIGLSVLLGAILGPLFFFCFSGMVYFIRRSFSGDISFFLRRQR